MPPVPPPQPPREGPTTVTVAKALEHALDACRQGQWAQGERLCRLVLSAQPGNFDALNLLGMIAVQIRRLPEAVDLLSRALVADPASVPALTTLAGALRDLGRGAEALDRYERALALEPGATQAWIGHGIVLCDLGRHAQAAESYERALALDPERAEVHFNLGVVLQRLGRHGEALASYERAIALRPDLADAHNNRGVALRELKRPAQALESHERAIALRPDNAEAHNNRGVVLRELVRLEEALESYARAIALRPDFAQAHFNRGAALGDLHRHAQALESFERAIALRPDHAEAHFRRGIALRDLKRHAEAVESFGRALRLDPDIEWGYGTWLNARMQICDWEGFEDHRDLLLRRIARRERVANPFPVLALSDRPDIQRAAAEIWVQARHAAGAAPAGIAAHAEHGKIRIGYFSADFFEHATAYLMAELLERHDRTSFEVTAFSFGRDVRDAMRQRVEAAVDRFIDVRGNSAAQIASLSRQLEIDIAVDLKGFTEDARTDIFALRAAPVQVSYLGYPGTMGAPFIDYIIADSTVIPEESQRHFAEAVAYLPGSYQVNDSKRRISGKAFTREELGLPREGFVFCSFNNSYKILPDVFGRWMRVLLAAEGSVLWLLQDNERAADNLRREAQRRGVGADRLVFAPRLPLAEHLARHRLADLFLDTLPYNAHTTASDALWAGVPVLTCLGGAFAGRVAASLLRAMRLPELVAQTPEEYEAAAIGLATAPEKAAALRQRLASHRLTTPLFDARLFARHVEVAYSAMHERFRAGLPPAVIHVPEWR